MPKVIVYNSVSVDGAIRDFEVNMELHYEIAEKICADATLVGSNTARTGIDMFMQTVPAEEPADFAKPQITADDKRPLLVVSDSKAVLMGFLHVCRKAPYWRDVVVLVSKATPKGYLDYLTKRNYDFIVTGSDHVDFHAALEQLNRQYGVGTVVTDTGPILAGVLLDEGLVNEVHLLVAPQLVGKNTPTLFRTLNCPVKLELIRNETMKSGHVLLIYEVKKSN